MAKSWIGKLFGRPARVAPATPVKDWRSAGCAACRQRAYGGPQMDQISANKVHPLFLYRCVACGAYWEETLRSCHVVDADEIAKMFPEVVMEPAPPVVSASALDDVIALLSRIDLANLAIHPNDEDLVGALESWDWLDISSFRPLMFTAFGDVFFDTPNGIEFLDTDAGALKPAAYDLNGLSRLLSSDDERDAWLREGLIRAVRGRGEFLGPGQCYDFKVAPALGGSAEADNVHATNFVVKVNIAGQLHRQIKALPPGTRINKVTIGPSPN